MRKLLFVFPLLFIIALVFSSTGLPAVAAHPVAEHSPADAALNNYQVELYMAEIYTDPSTDELGRTVFFSDRGNGQLAHDFVPGDPRRRAGATNITYHIDQTRPSADVPAASSEAAIIRAMATWDAETCSSLGLTKVPFAGFQTGFVASLFGFGGTPDYIADVNHAGWLPGAFFDLLAPDGGDFILGVTFTLIYIDADGNPTDIDNNGKIDVAFREIYYNDNFTWAIGSTFDIETVALHEAGHGLSQAHFGEAFRTEANGMIHFAPRAVMNAAYSGVQTELTGTDHSGHCSNWGQWPNN